MIEPVSPDLVSEAVDLLRQAGAMTLERFRSKDLRTSRKSDGTIVTEADMAAEQFLRAELARRHPDDAVLGEEEGETAGRSGRRWIVDPIDGTLAFAAGVPLYCNLLAVEDDHGLAVGVINLPALGETVYAGRGLGCFVNGAPAQVSETDRLPGATLTTSGFDYWSDLMLDGVRRAGCKLRTWGDGFGYALVATGRVDVMVDPVANPWDLAAVQLVVEEAGGRFSDAKGAPGYGSGSGVGSNGILHDQVVMALAGE